MSTKALLITGATGKQGGAVVDALLSGPNKSPFTIYALTRNPSSPGAVALTKKSPTVKLLQGDLNDCPAIFSRAPEPIWGVFSVQLPFGSGASVEGEEKQGKALIDAALAAGSVRHFVYASVERHGSRSDNDPTDVPHFRSKYNIEQHLKSRTENGTKGMTYTILRPVAFMENQSPDLMGKLFATMWKAALDPDRKLQLVSTADIGWFAARAFEQPEDPKYKNQAISLAGDDLTFKEASAVFRKVVGKDMPYTFEFVGQGVMWMVADLGIMFRWINANGYDANITELKKIHPGLLSLEEWLGRKESGFVKQG